MNFADIKYELFMKVVVNNIDPSTLCTEYKLTEDNIKSIIHKDSNVTEEEWKRWMEKFECKR